MHEESYLDELLWCCREHEIILIQDEVFTGFRRTGKMFAANHLRCQPDIVCLSKGLTGGTMPLGVTSCAGRIFDAFLSDDALKTLFHGHSFTANPLACTAALASLDLMEREDTWENIRRITRQHDYFKKEILDDQKLCNVRQCGTILAFDWNTGVQTSYFNEIRNRLYHYFLDRGILLRPLGNVLYLLPPYCTEEEDLEYIYSTIKAALVDL